MGASLVQAVGTEQQDRLIGKSSSQVMHQIQRSVICPMQVVDPERKRAFSRDAFYQTSDRLKEERTLQRWVSQPRRQWEREIAEKPT
jgi:hypothetical protein